MNYKRIYYSIIDNRKINKVEGYTEKHHIIPRCLGGDNSKDNLVRLTAKEHFICHLLLTKMYDKGTSEYYKMIHAFHMLSVVSKDSNQRYVTSRDYSHLKEDYSKIMSNGQKGEKNSQHGKMWIYNEDTHENMSVPKDTIIKKGWKKGRKLNSDCIYIYNLITHENIRVDKNYNIPEGWIRGNGRYIRCPLIQYKRRTYSYIKIVIIYDIVCQRCQTIFTSKNINARMCSLVCSSKKITRSVLLDTGEHYESLTDASKVLRVSVSTVRNRIKSGLYSYTN